MEPDGRVITRQVPLGRCPAQQDTEVNGTRIFARHCGITAFAEYPRINPARCSGAAPSKPRDLPSGSKQGTTNQFGHSRHNFSSSKELRKSECHSTLSGFYP